LAVAVAAGVGERDLWFKDLVNGTFQRLTAQPGTESQQAWSPDSRRLAYMSGEGLVYTEIGSGRQSDIPGGAAWRLLHSWTPDGEYLLGNLANEPGLFALPAPGARAQEVAADAARRLLPNEGSSNDHFRVSPDGRWAAYTSQESGRPEVIVAAFPGFTNRRQISQGGGTQPQWRADGRELYFHTTDQRLMAVDVTPGDALQAGPPRELFRTNPAVLSNILFMYAAAPDGQRFILVEPVEGAATPSEPLYVLTNWQALLDAQ
jgi:Tol biopolymer transport system component